MTKRDAGAILQAFYGAVNGRDLEQACQLLADNVRFATLDGDLIGKAEVCRYLQALVRTDVTFEINVLGVDTMTGSEQAVRYRYRIFAQGTRIDIGENGLAYLRNSLICFDGIESKDKSA